MRVLVTGASGFIGSAIVDALLARGHQPVPAVRDVDAARARWPALQPIAVDFTRDLHAGDWRPRLAGIDAVVNAVGILRERGGQSFETLHARAPQALFAACADTGVSRVVQISALGADAGARSRYHRSKRAADDTLLGLGIEACVMQPSLVFAPHGASAGATLAAVSLPLLPVPGDGRQAVAPVHLEDLCDAVVHVLQSPDPPPLRIAVVGPDCLPLVDYLSLLRGALGLGRPRFARVPIGFVRRAAALLGRLPASLIDVETIGMLERGNCADPRPLADLLGRPPRPVTAFVPAAAAQALRRQARLRWMLPLLRVSIAVVWIVTGVVSLGLYPVEDSLALLARTGLVGWPAQVALYGAAALDLALGVALLLPVRRQPVYVVQALLIGAYTLVITFALPEFWLHPYGPVLKNLPVLAALWLLHETDRRP